MEPIMSTQLSGAHPALSWRSVVAGLVLSLFTFITLLTLGIAVGGFSLTDGATLQNTGIYSAAWIIVSAAVALFAGSYFSSRITPYVSGKVGFGQGAILAAVFFGFVLWQSAAIVGSISSATSSLIGNAASATASAASTAGQGVANEIQQNGDRFNISGTANMMVEDALSGLDLKADATTVGAGVARRLAMGNTESAKSYLARNSNLSEAEINGRIDELNTQIQAGLVSAREQGARAMQVAGLTLFATMLIGFAAAAVGGHLGVRANRSQPLVAAPAQSSARFEPVFT